MVKLMFIYCFDEELKKQLQLNKYKIMKETNVNGQYCWIFVNKGNNINFNNIDSKKYLFSNKLNF